MNKETFFCWECKEEYSNFDFWVFHKVHVHKTPKTWLCCKNNNCIKYLDFLFTKVYPIENHPEEMRNCECDKKKDIDFI